MTTTLDTELEVFASAVRHELHDLGPDVIDELTDGLEADLTDSLADGGELGDPVEYAAELRAAAGLDPRGRGTRTSDIDAAARAAIAELRSEAAGFVAKHPLVRGVVEFFVSLRPVWWVLRGLAVFALLNAPTMSLVPQSEIWWIPLVGILVVSVQWGRGHWLPWRWSRPAVIVISVISLLVLPVVLANTANIASQRYEIYPEPMYDGVMLNGQQVTNIFAYGADGSALTDVRLFDQNGEPLAVVPETWDAQYNYDYMSGDEVIYVPSNEVAGTTGWNVYPLATVLPTSIDDNTASVESWAKRTVPDARSARCSSCSTTRRPNPPSSRSDLLTCEKRTFRHAGKVRNSQVSWRRAPRRSRATGS